MKHLFLAYYYLSHVYGRMTLSAKGLWYPEQGQELRIKTIMQSKLPLILSYCMFVVLEVSAVPCPALSHIRKFVKETPWRSSTLLVEHLVYIDHLSDLTWLTPTSEYSASNTCKYAGENPSRYLLWVEI
jgi:hypothetical protein